MFGFVERAASHWLAARRGSSFPPHFQLPIDPALTPSIAGVIAMLRDLIVYKIAVDKLLILLQGFLYLSEPLSLFVCCLS
jgi:hypothetical protein